MPGDIPSDWIEGNELSSLRVIIQLLDLIEKNGLTDAQLRAADIPVTLSDLAGTWGYAAGTSGTETLTGGKRVLQITAIALEAAATITIDGGDTITIPYGATDNVSSSLTITPEGNLEDPSIVFTGTDAYFVEFVV